MGLGDLVARHNFYLQYFTSSISSDLAPPKISTDFANAYSLSVINNCTRDYGHHFGVRKVFHSKALLVIKL